MTLELGWFPLWRAFYRSRVFLEGNKAELRVALWIMGNAHVDNVSDTPRGCVDVYRTDLARDCGLDRGSLTIALERLEAVFGFITSEQLPGRHAKTRLRVLKFRKWRGTEGATVPPPPDDDQLALIEVAAVGTDPDLSRGEIPHDDPISRAGKSSIEDPSCGNFQQLENPASNGARCGKIQHGTGENPASPPLIVKREVKGEPAVSSESRPASDHQQFVEKFTTLFQLHKRSKPAWNGKTGAMVKGLLKSIGLDEALKRAENMFAIEARGGLPWPKPPYDLATLVAHADKFVRAGGGGGPENPYERAARLGR